MFSSTNWCLSPRNRTFRHCFIISRSLESSENGFRIGYNCAVSACEAASEWRLAYELARGLEADLVLRTSLTSAAARALRWPRALRLLGPSAILRSQALVACLPCRWRHGLRLQRELRERYGLREDVMSLNLLPPGRSEHLYHPLSL